MAGSEDDRVHRERDTPDGASSRRARWTGWQHAHQQALSELQTAEAAYYRLTAEQAFGRGDDDASPARLIEARTRLENLRLPLDEDTGHHTHVQQ